MGDAFIGHRSQAVGTRLQSPMLGLVDVWWFLTTRALVTGLSSSRALADFFARPTIAALAEVLGGGAGVAESIPVADRGQPLPVSFSQQRLWFLFAVDPEA